MTDRQEVKVVRRRDLRWNRVTLTRRFRSTEDALTWLRADVARLKDLPAEIKGWLKGRPRWEVHEGGKTILTVDEWGRETAA